MKWCYKKKYDLIITMDGDGTHNPKYIRSLIDKNLLSDITITNRFLKKNSLQTWHFIRIFITNVRHFLICVLLGIKFDSSGAFRCIKSNKVKLEDLLSINENDYTYFWKSIYYLNLKYKINEIPISLPGRKLGYSKMKISHVLSSLIILITFSIKEKIFKKFL